MKEKEYEYLATEGEDEDPSYKEYYFFHRFKMTQYTGFTKVCAIVRSAWYV